MMDLPQLTQVQQVALLMPCTSAEHQLHQRYRSFRPPWSLVLTADHVDRTEGWAWHASVALLAFDKSAGHTKPLPREMWPRWALVKVQRILDDLLRGVGAGPDEQYPTETALQVWRPLTEDEKRIALTRVPEDWKGGSYGT